MNEVTISVPGVKREKMDALECIKEYELDLGNINELCEQCYTKAWGWVICVGKEDAKKLKRAYLENEIREIK